MFIGRNTTLHFDSCGIEYISLEVVNRIRDKSIDHNILTIQDWSIMCGFHCIAFIECMLAGKNLLDYSNLFSLNDDKKSDKIIYKYFKGKHGRRSKCWILIKKNWWNKKLSFRWNKTMI